MSEVKLQALAHAASVLENNSRNFDSKDDLLLTSKPKYSFSGVADAKVLPARFYSENNLNIGYCIHFYSNFNFNK